MSSVISDEGQKKPVMTAKLFFENTKSIFQKNKIELHTVNDDFINYMKGYSLPINIKRNKFINEDILDDKLKLIWHAVAGLQIELANFLIYFSQYDSKSLDKEAKTLTRSLCFHHLSLSYECIYRVWEKFTQVLHYMHTYNPEKRNYYNKMVELIAKSEKYDALIVKKLKSQIKNWDKIASKRNEYSHEETKIFNFEYKVSRIVNQYGLPYEIHSIALDFEDEKRDLILRYRQLSKLNNILIEFIDNYPKPLILAPDTRVRYTRRIK